MTKNNAALRVVSADSLAEYRQLSGAGGCSSCAIRATCLRPRGASVACLPGLKTARADRHLVRAGDPCEQYFLPRSGTLKAYRNTLDDREQVMGFYLAA